MPSPLESNDRGARTCPRCRKKTLEFAEHVAVLSAVVRGKRAKREIDDEKDRLTYEPAWLCRNRQCKYLRLIDG